MESPKDIQPLPMEQRIKLLENLRIESPGKAHELIVSGIKHGVHRLLNRGLVARRLIQLGYSADAMRKLGCDAHTLEQLGYETTAPRPAAMANPLAPDAAEGNSAQQIRSLIDNGARATDLHARGIPIEAVRRIGLSAAELTRIGYAAPELATVCGAAEMRRAGFGPRDLRRFFGEPEMVGAGFSATEMRTAGYTIRDLMRLGFSENQIRTAGYSNAELVNEGLTRTTRI